MLKLAGENCEKIMGQKVRKVKVQDVQADEIWGYVQKKESHKWPHEAHDNSVGDAYTFVAIESKTKLVLNLALGRRDQLTTNAFIEGFVMPSLQDRSESARMDSPLMFRPSTTRLGTAWASRKSSRYMRQSRRQTALFTG